MKRLLYHCFSNLKKQLVLTSVFLLLGVLLQNGSYAMRFDDLRPVSLWQNFQTRLVQSNLGRPSLYTLLKEGRDSIENQSASTSVWLAATGDLMFHSTQINAAYQTESGTYDFKDTFKSIKPYLSAADYTFGNFETTTAGAERSFSGYPAFNAPDATLDAIKWAGYDFLSTANNHCLDKGVSGLERTITQIRDRDLAQSGTFMQNETDAQRYALLSINNINLAVITLTYGCNGLENSLAADTRQQVVNLIDEVWLEDTLGALELTEVDETIVFIHWGNEYQRDPSTYQKNLADKLFSWGADIVLGSHPHVIQPSEIVEFEGETKYIIYSMGNFVSNQSRHTLSNSNRKYTENGVVPYIQLTKSGEDTVITAVRHLPTWVYKYTDSSGTHYDILPLESDSQYTAFENIKSQTQDAYKATMAMMQDYSAFE